MAAANIISDALNGSFSNSNNGTLGMEVAATALTVPFGNAVAVLQSHITTASRIIDAHCPVSTEVLLLLFPFFVGFVRVAWPILRASLSDLRARQRRVAVRDIVSVSAPVYHGNGLPTDRNALLQNAIFMYLTRCVWPTTPIPASKWRNTPSVLLLLDPYRSRCYERHDSPFNIKDGDSSSDDDGGDLAFAGIARSAKKLERLILVKVPVSGCWVDVQDKSGVELTYKRQRINIAATVAVERTVSLRARGVDATQVLEDFTQRCLSYFIAQIPNMNNATRSFYELQPPKTVSALSSDDEKLCFKRYPLNEEKNMDTVFFPEKAQIMKFIDDFLFHRGRFTVEGFPYKLGFLLHGPPGSGKTTFVKALAAYTGRHIVSVPLHTVQTNQQLYDVFLNRTFSCVGESEDQTIQLDDVIFLLDDVDAASPLVCSRQRRRTVRRRRPAVLTARELSAEERQRRHEAARLRTEERENKNNIDGHDGEEVEEDSLDDSEADDEDELEEHVVELQERKLGGGRGGMSRLLAGLPVGPELGGMGPTMMGPQAMSAQNLFSLAGAAGAGGSVSEEAPVAGGDSMGTGSLQASATAGANGKLSASAAAAAGAGPGGFGFNAKKSLFSLFESADKLDLSGLLNVLDGVVDTPGRIVVMVTNHPEQLDPALVRPGRMSTRLRLDYIRFDALSRMAGLHFGDEHPSKASQDVVHIAERLEAEVMQDRGAVRAAVRYRAAQAKATRELAEEMADDDDVDASTTMTATKAILKDAKATGVKSAKDGKEEEEEKEKPVSIPPGAAAARIPHRTLSAAQTKALRSRIAALEAEATMWKLAHKQPTANGTSHAASNDADGEAPFPPAPAAVVAAANDPLHADASGVLLAAMDASGQPLPLPPLPPVCPYTFHISPSEVEMMCAQTDTLEEFIDLLAQVIKGEVTL